MYPVAFSPCIQDPLRRIDQGSSEHSGTLKKCIWTIIPKRHQAGPSRFVIDLNRSNYKEYVKRDTSGSIL